MQVTHPPTWEIGAKDAPEGLQWIMSTKSTDEELSDAVEEFVSRQLAISRALVPFIPQDHAPLPDWLERFGADSWQRNEPALTFFLDGEMVLVVCQRTENGIMMTIRNEAGVLGAN